MSLPGKARLGMLAGLDEVGEVLVGDTLISRVESNLRSLVFGSVYSENKSRLRPWSGHLGKRERNPLMG